LILFTCQKEGHIPKESRSNMMPYLCLAWKGYKEHMLATQGRKNKQGRDALE
jgi:hypothetical protein